VRWSGAQAPGSFIHGGRRLAAFRCGCCRTRRLHTRCAIRDVRLVERCAALAHRIDVVDLEVLLVPDHLEAESRINGLGALSISCRRSQRHRLVCVTFPEGDTRRCFAQ
jgi:hypothetical protein